MDLFLSLFLVTSYFLLYHANFCSNFQCHSSVSDSCQNEIYKMGYLGILSIARSYMMKVRGMTVVIVLINFVLIYSELYDYGAMLSIYFASLQCKFRFFFTNSHLLFGGKATYF